MTILVTRHTGAIKWLRSKGLTERVTPVRHLNIHAVKQGDVVVGVLPISIAAKICAMGARYIAIEVAIPFGARGKELSCGEMDMFGAV